MQHLNIHTERKKEREKKRESERERGGRYRVRTCVCVCVKEDNADRYWLDSLISRDNEMSARYKNWNVFIDGLIDLTRDKRVDLVKSMCVSYSFYAYKK